jgi:tetratricopeptide (TPR) repeat protein
VPDPKADAATGEWTAEGKLWIGRIRLLADLRERYTTIARDAAAAGEDAWLASQWDTARAHLTRACAHRPDLEKPALMLARTEVGAGNVPRALQIVEGLILSRVGDTPALLTFASDTAYAAGLFAKSARYAEDYLKRFYDGSERTKQLDARVLELLDRHTAALRDGLSLSGSDAENDSLRASIERFETALGFVDWQIDPYLKLADVHLRLGDSAAALAVLRRARELGREPAEAIGSMDYQYIRLSSVAGNWTDVSAAAPAWLRQYAEGRPESAASVWLWLGQARELASDLDGARDAYRSAQAAHPNSATAAEAATRMAALTPK